MSGQLLLLLLTGTFQQSLMWHTLSLSLTHLPCKADRQPGGQAGKQAASISLARHSRTKLRQFVTGVSAARHGTTRHVCDVCNSALVDSVGDSKRV